MLRENVPRMLRGLRARDRKGPTLLRTETNPDGAEFPATKELVFHHQPKTAGSTLREFIASKFPDQEVSWAEIDDEIKALSDSERERLRFFAGHYRFETLQDHFPDAVWLTFLRNPVERLVSNFYNLRDSTRHNDRWRNRAHERPEVTRFLDKVREMSLEEFVWSEEPRAIDRYVNRQTRYLVRRTQRVKECPTWDDGILDQAKKNLEEQFTFVGIQEEFNLSVSLLCATLGLQGPEDLGRYTTNVNVKEKSNEKYDLPQNVTERLNEMNQMDFALWEFGRKLLHRRAMEILPSVVQDDYRRRHQCG